MDEYERKIKSKAIILADALVMGTPIFIRGERMEVTEIKWTPQGVVFYASGPGGADMLFPLSTEISLTPPCEYRAWTTAELMRHWNSAFVKKDDNGVLKSLCRMNIASGSAMIAGKVLETSELLEKYLVNDTPWDASTWQVCGVKIGA